MNWEFIFDDSVIPCCSVLAVCNRSFSEYDYSQIHEKRGSNAFLFVAVFRSVFTSIQFKLNQEVIFTQDKPTLFALVIDVRIKLEILEKKWKNFMDQ